MPRFVNKVGNKYGKLTVVEFAGRDKNKIALWRCKCSCGKTLIARGTALTSGNKTSCGCEDLRLAKTRVYEIWHAIKSRCYRKKHSHYKNYGGRGITICDEWKNDFMSFYEWAMNNGYDDSLSIDRINVDGNYEPDNCRWVTQKEQGNNRRNNHYITYNGETHTLTEWCELYNLTVSSLNYRISRGWDMKKALETPVIEHLFVTINGETKSASEWESIYGVPRKTARERVNRGWNPIDAVTVPLREFETVEINGERKTIKEWSDVYKVSVATIYYRIKNGMNPTDAITKPLERQEMKIAINGETKGIREWAKIYGIGESAIRARISRGWNPVDAITTPPKFRRKVGDGDGNKN